MSTVEQQRRPNGPAAIVGIVLFIVGLILLFNGVPGLFGVIGQAPSYIALMGTDRAIETLLPYAILPVVLTIAGLLMVRGGFGMLRKQGTKGAQWARSEWQDRQPEVQQRFASAREQLQAQGGGAWQQAQQRVQQQSPAWAQQGQQQRPGWPGQQPGGQQQRTPPPPQASQRRQQQQPQQGQRGQSTLERMQQRIADASGAADRARDAAMAQHEQQSAALQRRAAKAADAAQQIASGMSPHVPTFGSPALGSGKRTASILASSSLRSSSLGRTSLSLDSLRLRR